MGDYCGTHYLFQDLRYLWDLAGSRAAGLRAPAAVRPRLAASPRARPLRLAILGSSVIIVGLGV